MPAADALARSLDRVDRSCAMDLDALTLRLRLVEELRRAVAFDGYAWLLTDPETWVGCAPLADLPATLLPLLPQLIRLKYLSTVNRWTSLGRARVALLQEATGGDPARSPLWRDVLGPHGVGDVASIVFTDRFGCWGFLDLWRSGPVARFTSAEARHLTRAVPVVTAALRRSQAATFEAKSRPAPTRGPVVLLLSPRLDVRTQTPQTEEYLRVLVPPSGDAPPVPASAYNVAAQLLAGESGVDAHPPTARVHLSDGLWLTLRAARTGAATSSDDIAVTIEPTPPTERAEVFARAYGLGAREREVLDHLVAGLDTREVARRMVLSEHTVQDHVKAIFAKTSANTRGALVSRALGT